MNVQKNTSQSKVTIVGCRDYESDNVESAVGRVFELLGGVGEFIGRGDSVLLKPNFIAAKGRARSVQTDPAVILAVAKMCKDFGARPFIGDSPAWNSLKSCIKVLGLEEPLKQMGVPVRKLNRPRRIRLAGSSFGISCVALEADKVINLPKFKTHQQLGATFAVKNMYGVVCGKEKAFWHYARGRSYRRFCRMLIEIFKLISPALTIIDSVVAMEGSGPIGGTPRPLGCLIGGVDPIACEMVCSRLVGFEPDDLPIIRAARKIDFGCSDWDQIEITGDDWRDFVCPDFDPGGKMPLYFTFSHVCRSVYRQAVLLTRGVIGKG
ncbi:MAG: DUF362 domain-containing protein [Sedimentisphaerales bacterium]|nr:DUF362 domain-containing protein [Sedimentisphaerales bacterium]